MKFLSGGYGIHVHGIILLLFHETVNIVPWKYNHLMKIGFIKILANQNNPVQFFNENILIQNSLLNAALKFKLRRTVFLGTSCIYPENSITPIKVGTNENRQYTIDMLLKEIKWKIRPNCM